MHSPNRRAATAIVAALAAATAGVIGSTGTVVASASTPPRVVTVTVSGHGIAMDPGTTLPAGTVFFEVKAPKGDHTLQILRLHSGYSKKQANHDVDAAFGGNVKAVRRVDRNIDWLGGNEATPGHPGMFAVHLSPGSYIAVDQDSTAATPFDVVAAASNYRTLYPSSFVTTKNNRFHTHTSLALPHNGWLKFHNNAEEPHMFVLQHVKQSTTKRDVRDYVASGSEKPPSWGLPEAIGSAVVSPGTTQVFHYSMPAGKYLVACFWPSKQTGMPHFSMGMWRLIELS
jgi:hypothetical protein